MSLLSKLRNAFQTYEAEPKKKPVSVNVYRDQESWARFSTSSEGASNALLEVFLDSK